MTIVAVAETHLHNDYVSGGPLLARRHHADYLLSAEERVDVERVGVRDGDVVPVGNLASRCSTPLVTRCTTRRSTSPGPSRNARERSSAAAACCSARSVAPISSTACCRGTWRGPSGSRPGGSAPWTPRPRCTPPTASAASAPEPPRRPTAGRRRRAAARQRRAAPGSRRLRRGAHRRLRAGAGVLPPDGAAQPRRRRRGSPVPPRPLTAVETAAVQRVGGWVVDVRSAEDHVAGALPGSVSIPYGDQLATWVGWLVPWGAPLVLVARSVADLEARVRDLHRIGIEDIGHPRARRRPPRRPAACTGARLGRPRRARRPASAHDDRRRAARRTPARRGRGRPPARRTAHPPAGPARPRPQPPSRRALGALPQRLPRRDRRQPDRPDRTAGRPRGRRLGQRRTRRDRGAPPSCTERPAAAAAAGSSQAPDSLSDSERSPSPSRRTGPSTSCAEESWASRAVARGRPPGLDPGTGRRRLRRVGVVRPPGWSTTPARTCGARDFNSLRAGAPMPHPGRSARQGPCSVERSVT